MTARGVGTHRLAKAAGVVPSAIGQWRGGWNLPRTDTALRVAESLSWPRLAEIARGGRTLACAHCGHPFVNEGGGPKLYCSPECRDIAGQLRKPSPAVELAAAVRAELGRKARMRGGIPKAALAAALAAYNAGEARRGRRVDGQGRALALRSAAIDAMCRACEPDGYCRMAECPLRPVSPLPYREARDVALATKAPGAWGPENRERMTAAVGRSSRERWARPGERGRNAELHRGLWARMSPEQRAERGRAASAGRRKAATA
jgi:hypothetical protein